MTHSTPTLVRIVECLAPEFPRLDPGVRTAVLDDVAAFVVRQVDALPDFLRYPYRFALVAFEWLPAARWGRRFRRLDESKRRTYLALWSDSPLTITRNFVKLIRSCALLAFYDHPAVQAPLRDQAPRPSPAAAVRR